MFKHLAAASTLLISTASVFAQDSRVNVGHLAPFDSVLANTAVSVSIDGTEVATGVQFNQFSGYLTQAAGTDTLVEVFAPPRTSMMDVPAITLTVDLVADTDYSVIALGDGTNQALSLLPLVDDNTAPTAGSAKIRVVHAAPFAADLTDTAVSIRLDDGTVVNGLSSVQFGQESGFFELPAGNYDLQVASPDGSQAFINLAPVDLADGDIVTVFAVGDGTNQPLGATLFASDGSSADLPLEPTARVNVGHLAPFDADLAATAVAVNLNGAEVLTGVQFNQLSGYLPVDATSTTVDVFAPPGAATAAISATVGLIADTDYSVLALGDATNQPLQLLALVDDNTAPTAGSAKLRIVHAAPFAAELSDTAVSIRLDDGTVVNSLDSVQFGQESGFFELAAGTYDLQVASPDGTQRFIDLAPVTLTDGAIVTVFAVGDGGNQPLGATAFFSDGTSAALPLEIDELFANGFESARVNVGHLAPFAADLMDTAVSVNVNGAEVLTGVEFNQFSDYQVLPVGQTTLEVFTPPGAMMPAISAEVVLESDTDYTVLALGDVTNQDLVLLPLVDTTPAPAAGEIAIRIVHAAPFAPALVDTAVSIRLDDGTVVNGLDNVQFGVESGFFALPEGTYDLQIASPDGTQVFIDLAPVELPAGAVLTVFAIGDGVNQPLGVSAFFSDGSVADLPLE